MSHPNDIVELYDYESACPSQFEGKLRDGTCFYARFRSNRIRIGFGATLSQALDRALGSHKREPLYQHIPEDGEPNDGFMTWAEMEPHVMLALATYRAELSGVAVNPVEE